MRRQIIRAGILLASVMMLTACQGKQRDEARMIGIEQMKNKDYAGAIESFEKALELSGGKVSAFQLDVLKYRAEAEYQLADYAAAAHTYDILIQVDEPQLDYYVCHCMALAQAGEYDAAVEAYRKAAVLVSGGEAGAGEDKTDKAATNESETDQDQTEGDKAEDAQAAGDETDAAGSGSTEQDTLARLLVNLGEILEQQPEYQDIAAALYQEALDAGEAPAVLYNRAGLSLLNDGQYEAAITAFNQGISRGDAATVQELRYNLAVAYEKKLDFATALELFEQYAADYGTDAAVEKEIAFLKTR